MSNDKFPLPGQVGEPFLRYAREPKNLGCLENASGKGTAIGQCGDSIDVSLRIDRDTITDIKVFPHGCVYTLVCASAMSELAKGRDLDQALELEPGRGGGGPRRSAGGPHALCPARSQYPG